ncbi:MAG: MerR family DNA-binding transcriptional regulator [Acidithiobacillus sp.]
MGELTIAKLGREAGIHVETIRFYQRKGLLPEPARPAGGMGCCRFRGHGLKLL